MLFLQAQWRREEKEGREREGGEREEGKRVEWGSRHPEKECFLPQQTWATELNARMQQGHHDIHDNMEMPFVGANLRRTRAHGG